MTNLAKTLISVPTYWTYEEGKEDRENSIYDHPTPLNQDGTLFRLLESLKVIEGVEFGVLVVSTATNPELKKAVETKVDKIIEPFKGVFPIAQFSFNDLEMLKKRLSNSGIRKEMASLRGYGNIRNIQLISAQIIGAQVIVGLDDDEIITDKNYLKKIWEFVGKEHDGEFVGSIAGFYRNKEGSNKVSKGETKSKNIFDNKPKIMDKAVEIVEKKRDRLVETNFAYGGNMAIHCKVFQNIPFDPYINRGEDIDYLINTRMAGYHFFLNKELFIVHLPPAAGSHLPEDLKRFIYERAKIGMTKEKPELCEFSPESFEPYPGAFLHDDLEEQALEVLRDHYSAQRVINEAKRYAQKMLPRYFNFQKEWPHLMEVLWDDTVLKTRLKQKMEVSR